MKVLKLLLWLPICLAFPLMATCPVNTTTDFHSISRGHTDLQKLQDDLRHRNFGQSNIDNSWDKSCWLYQTSNDLDRGIRPRDKK